MYVTSPPREGFINSRTDDNNPFSVIFVPVELRQRSPKQLLSAIELALPRSKMFLHSP
jgi:hypothetical protein